MLMVCEVVPIKLFFDSRFFGNKPLKVGYLTAPKLLRRMDDGRLSVVVARRPRVQISRFATLAQIIALVLALLAFY